MRCYYGPSEGTCHYQRRKRNDSENRTSENREKDYSRTFQLPQALCQLIDDKIAEDTGDKVLFPEAEYILSGIVELAEKYPNKRFVIPTMNPVMFQLQTLAYESYPNVDVVCTNIYDADFTDEKYDFIFSFHSSPRV